MRCLLVRERIVPADRSDEYRAAWADIVQYATEASAHAWVFRSASAEDLFIEFVEWPCDGEMGVPADVAAALARLDTIAVPATSSTWKEWKT